MTTCIIVVARFKNLRIGIGIGISQWFMVWRIDNIDKILTILVIQLPILMVYIVSIPQNTIRYSKYVLVSADI